MNTGPTDDRLAIRELIEHYCNAVNQRDAALWGANWAEDSEWNLPVVPGMESVKGKAAIVAAWVESMKLLLHLGSRGDAGWHRIASARAV